MGDDQQQHGSTSALAYLDALIRHIADLRGGTHGGLETRPEKEALFCQAVGLLDARARQALDEINRTMLVTPAQSPPLASSAHYTAAWRLGETQLAGPAADRPAADHDPRPLRTDLPSPASSRHNSR